MTTMTMMHFASPFSISMPVPAKAALRPVRGTAAASGVEATDTAASTTEEEDTRLLPIGSDHVSLVAMDGPADAVAAVGAASNFYDVVMRRYGEQQLAMAPLESEATGEDPSA